MDSNDVVYSVNVLNAIELYIIHTNTHTHRNNVFKNLRFLFSRTYQAAQNSTRIMDPLNVSELEGWISVDNKGKHTARGSMEVLHYRCTGPMRPAGRGDSALG